MKPPYAPGHVENVSQVPYTGGALVVATCSCTGALGPRKRLGAPGVARGLIDDFNAHRATYVQESA